MGAIISKIKVIYLGITIAITNVPKEVTMQARVYVPSLQTGVHSEDPHGWRFATSMGPWGQLLAEYYEVVREALPNELIFWQSLVSHNMDVLEIGAGSGFVSKALAEANPRVLTLVEPEKEHVKLLRRASQNWKTECKIEVLEKYFENTNVAPQDLIIFPYDSLPMVIGQDQRLRLFKAAHERLKGNGIFAVHVSTPKWVVQYLRSTEMLSINDFLSTTGNKITVKRFSKPISNSEFIKFVSVYCPNLKAKENYVALTSIVTDEEIMGHASDVGFTLYKKYGDFHKNGFVNSSDDAIYFFKKDT